jgi:hypothetical protein
VSRWWCWHHDAGRTPGGSAEGPGCLPWRPMSSRLDKSWMVLASHQTDEANRCVDIFSRPDGTYGFEEFRRDPEDMGAWTPVRYFSGRAYPTEIDAVEAARSAVSWLGPLLSR